MYGLSELSYRALSLCGTLSLGLAASTAPVSNFSSIQTLLCLKFDTSMKEPSWNIFLMGFLRKV